MWGTVRRVEPYGVFVGIDGTRLSGLLHISCISRSHIDNVDVRARSAPLFNTSSSAFPYPRLRKSQRRLKGGLLFCMGGMLWLARHSSHCLHARGQVQQALLKSKIWDAGWG